MKSIVIFERWFELILFNRIKNLEAIEMTIKIV